MTSKTTDQRPVYFGFAGQLIHHRNQLSGPFRCADLALAAKSDFPDQPIGLSFTWLYPLFCFETTFDASSGDIVSHNPGNC